jgi:hypothetical protein
MTPDDGRGQQIHASISGPVQGQVAVGAGITQHQQGNEMRQTLTAAQRTEIADVFAALREQLAAQLPEADRTAALERVGELEQTICSEQPDLTTIGYVKQWFARRLPAAAGLVTSVLVHPLIGGIVSRAAERLGDALI